MLELKDLAAALRADEAANEAAQTRAELLKCKLELERLKVKEKRQKLAAQELAQAENPRPRMTRRQAVTGWGITTLICGSMTILYLIFLISLLKLF